jgi:hypothetical protein
MMDNLKDKLSMNDVATHAKFRRQKKWPKILETIEKA